MARNINQIYSDNPITSVNDSYLIYLGASGVDGAAQFVSLQSSITRLGTLSQPVVLGNGNSIRTTTANASTYSLQAYDVDGSSYKTFLTLTAGNTPVLDITAPVGGNIFINGVTIGNVTPGNASFTQVVVDSITIDDTSITSSNNFFIQTSASNGSISLKPIGTGKVNIISNDASNIPSLCFYNQAGSNFTALKSGASSSDTTYTLPLAYPVGGTQVLASNTSGTMSWVNFVVGPGSSVTGAAAYYADTTGSQLTYSNRWYVIPGSSVAANINMVFGGSPTISGGENCLIAAAQNGFISQDSVKPVNCAIIGGTFNTITNGVDSAIIGGQTNTVLGEGSVCLGGRNNQASRNFSYAMGIRAIADNDGCFVFCDTSDFSNGLTTTASNQALYRSTGGFGFISGNLDLTSFPNNMINFYSDTGDNKLKAKYKNNSGTTSTTVINLLETKGDLYTYSTLPIRLAVGANNAILHANSAAATGLEWTLSPGGLTSIGVGNLSMSASTISSSAGVMRLISTVPGNATEFRASGGMFNFLDQAATAPSVVYFYGSGNTNAVGLTVGTLSGTTVYTLPTAFPASTQALMSSSTGVMSFQALTSGTYTPTLTNTANIAASTAYVCQYMRVGNTVTVSGRVDVQVTSPATLSQLGISLPVASNLSASNQLGGAAAAYTIASEVYGLIGDATNDVARLQWTSSDLTNHAVTFSFTYLVI